jgi:hypothetical protein
MSLGRMELVLAGAAIDDMNRHRSALAEALAAERLAAEAAAAPQVGAVAEVGFGGVQMDLGAVEEQPAPVMQVAEVY